MSNNISDKDKKDWEKFLSSSEKLNVKDKEILTENKVLEKTIDLHGFTLDQANKKISEYIEFCYQNRVKKINVITGKGMRSKNLDDPYQSSNLSILKHSVPEFIQNNSELMNKIIRIDLDAINSQSTGSFGIFLKTIK